MLCILSDTDLAELRPWDSELGDGAMKGQQRKILIRLEPKSKGNL